MKVVGKMTDTPADGLTIFPWSFRFVTVYLLRHSTDKILQNSVMEKKKKSKYLVYHE